MAAEIHQADAGTAIEITVQDDGAAVNLTGSTVTYYFRRPNGTSFSRSASIITAASGLTRYVTTSADFDAVGWWELQAGVVFSGSQAWRTDVATFQVFANIT